MKKSLKLILIILSIVLLIFILDIGSIVLMKKPIFAIYNDRVYYGLFYNTYNCFESSKMQIKLKWEKFNCKENINTTLIYGKITDIRDNYIVIVTLKDSSSLKINEEAHITLNNNPKINGVNNLIIGQYVQIEPVSIAEIYPVIITTNTIDIIDKITTNEYFMLGNTLNDGRVINFTFDVPYKETGLNYALTYNEISVDDFVSKLEFVDELRDGGSKLYEYNKNTKIFGNENFYVMVCNSLDDIKDIFVAKNKEILSNKCYIKIDDLDGVSMTIKNDTLKNTGATLIIKDISSRKNIYGEDYELEIFKNGVWDKLAPINDITFNEIGYTVDKNNTLKLDVNWEYHYGKLKSGKYRILKGTLEVGEGTKHYITSEFTIN